MAADQTPNPFSPTFGTTPPLLAGRDGVLERFAEALDSGPTHPDYTLLITGDRGTGKTALLNVLEAQAADRGWMTITATATSEPISVRIGHEVQRCIEHLRRGKRGTRLSAVSLMGIGVSLEQKAPGDGTERSLLSALEELGELLSERGTGLLLTVDELHDVERDDVRDIASAIQIVTRRRLHPVAFAAAALPLIEQSHLADANMTFLQRCARAPLGMLDPDETRRALLHPVVESGGVIDSDALDEAVEATSGYPYSIQLVGFHAWRMRQTPDGPITLVNIQAGAAEAEREMVDQIAGPIWNRLSSMDRRFLVAMLEDNPDSALSDIAQRIDRSLDYARTYRQRLLSAGAISPTAKTRVRFRHRAVRSRTQSALQNDPTLSL